MNYRHIHYGAGYNELAHKFDTRTLMILALLSIFCLSASHVKGAGNTVYVTAFTSPSSGHAGTLIDPYQTYTEPCAVLNGQGGNIIMLGNGATIYTQPWYMNSCNGATNSPIVITSNTSIPTTWGANAAAPTITNSNSGNLSGRTFQLQYATNWVKFENINVTNGIAAGQCFFTETNASTMNHHITWDHLGLIGCGENSIQTQSGDYYTITNNYLSGNGMTATDSESAIHVYQPNDFDLLAGVHILIAYNYVAGEGRGVGPQSDGMCYEIDDANHTQNNDLNRWPAYKSLISVHDNIGTGCDGDGYHGFLSSAPQLVYNNLFSGNDQNQPSGTVFDEVTSNGSNVQAYNNIIVPKSSAYYCGRADTTVVNSGPGAGTYLGTNIEDYNNCYGAHAGNWVNGGSGATMTIGGHDVTGNPLISGPNFVPQTGSAAVGHASPFWSSVSDILGIVRNRKGVLASNNGLYSANTLDIGPYTVTP